MIYDAKLIQIESKKFDENGFYSSHYSPVRVSEEPYKGFFVEKGFPQPKYYTEVADVGSHFPIETFNIFTEKSRNLTKKLCTPLPIFPTIASRQTLYIHGNGCELSFGNSRLGPNDDPNKRIKVVDLFELNKRVKEGEDPKAIMQPMFDALTKNNCAFWHGYVIDVVTSGNNQSVVLDEDFNGINTSKDTVTNFNSYAKKWLGEIYNKLDKKKVSEFIKSLERRYDDLTRIITSSFRQSELIEERLRYEDENAIDEKKLKEIQKQIYKPYDKWLENYEKGFEESGLLDAEKQLEEKVNSYNRSTVGLHGQRELVKFRSPTVEENYRKNLLMETLGAILR